MPKAYAASRLQQLQQWMKIAKIVKW